MKAIGLLEPAAREGWRRGGLLCALLVALPTLTEGELNRLVEAVATPEDSRRRAEPRLA
jgi:hypothetical protein